MWCSQMYVIEARTCEYIMWCQPNGHDTVWLITRALMLWLKGCRPEREEFDYVRLYKLQIWCMSTTWLKCALWGTIPSYALWSCGRGGASLLNKWFNFTQSCSLPPCLDICYIYHVIFTLDIFHTTSVYVIHRWISDLENLQFIAMLPWIIYGRQWYCWHSPGVTFSSFHLLSRCRPSTHQGQKRKLWCFKL